MMTIRLSADIIAYTYTVRRSRLVRCGSLPQDAYNHSSLGQPQKPCMSGGEITPSAAAQACSSSPAASVQPKEFKVHYQKGAIQQSSTLMKF